MGISCCGCINTQKLATPRVILGEHRQQSTPHRSKRKFQDIQPLDGQELALSQLDLASLNHQLSEYIVEYEIQNGKITKRFTQRLFQDEVLNDFLFENNKENLERIPLNEQQSQKETISFNKNKQIPDQPHPQIHIQQIYIENDDNESDFMSDNQDSLLKDKNQSCLLSLSSRILNDTIFTNRILQKKQFYKKYNTIGGVQLEEWTYIDRISYELTDSQILAFNGQCKDGKFIICMASVYLYWIHNCVSLLSYHSFKNAIKIYINGQPKLYHMQNSNKFSLQLIHSFIGKLKFDKITHLTYFLTGWIPEIIKISELKLIDGVIQRLSANVDEGNTLISFSKENDGVIQYTVLQKIDTENQLIFMNTFNTKTTIPSLFLQNNQEELIDSPSLKVVSYQNFIQLFDQIHINWNPFIYEQRLNQNGLLTSSQPENKYMVTIPPSSQDLQLRIMIQKHHNFQTKDQQEIIIKLFQYSNHIKTLSEPIRTIIVSDLIYSDVFIFQTCHEKTFYLLTIGFNEPLQVSQQINYTASLLSFAEIKFKPYQQKILLTELAITASITPVNTGYGINSPYFDKNLQFSITTQVGNDIQVLVNAKKKLVYEICLIPDPKNCQQLHKLQLETIINDSQISNYQRGSGNFVIKASHKHYILLINAYTALTADIQITIKSYGHKDASSAFLDIKPTNYSLQVALSRDIQWLPTHSGARKRSKFNTISHYQPLVNFKEFFNNPAIEKALTKGKYQFYIKSLTYNELFDSVDSYQDKNFFSPPTLSLAIFIASKQDKQMYKIILDDVFYVPFGIGFWSTQIQLQQGYYKFVLPKMEKGFSKGNFGIIKC